MGRLKIIFQILIQKSSALWNWNCSFSARIFSSRIDSRAVIRQNVRFQGSSIGKYSYVSRNCLVQNADIGNFCSIAEGANIGMPSHPVTFVSSSPVFLSRGNVLHKNFADFEFEDCPRTTIDSDVWIGAHAQIKSGLRIGTGAVIGAGAVVTHDVPPYAIVGGIPAKVIRFRFDEVMVKKLMASRWWELDDNEISEIAYMFNNVNGFVAMNNENMTSERIGQGGNTLSL